MSNPDSKPLTDADVLALIDDRLRERFAAKHAPSPAGCWEWSAGKKNGYGRFNVGTHATKLRNMAAHRVSWLIHRGELPTGLLVCHECDNPGCVNPDHLFLGTQLNNMRDCAAKGRIVPGGYYHAKRAERDALLKQSPKAFLIQGVSYDRETDRSNL